MRVAIMQPNFIPWMGYFKLIETSDLFIFLDDVEYSKNTWHNRNNLLLNDGSIYLWTLPIRASSSKQNFNNIFIDQNSLRINKLKNLLRQNFKKSANFDIFERVLDIVEDQSLPLSIVNENIINLMSTYLGITTNTQRASEVLSEGMRSEKILGLLKEVGASTYIAVDGAKSYMMEDGFEEFFPGEIEFFKFSCEYSRQKLDGRQDNLSALNYILDN